MQMLYNSDSYAVVQFEPPEAAPSRGGYEIVDKFARKEIFIQGVLAESFKQGVQDLMQGAPSEEDFDEFIGRFTQLGQQPLVMH